MTNQLDQRAWSPDILDGFEQTRLDLSGGQHATLIRMARQGTIADDLADRPAVLYLHGFVDYFFQTHLARAFEARGYRFYAIDLRGYGRSIDGITAKIEPNFVPEISTYTEDLDSAAAVIAAEQTNNRLVGVGHSTGGLIIPLWAAAKENRLEAMILNSPWLDLNANWFMRGPVTQAIHVLAKLMPNAAISALHVHYGRALHRDTGGEWDYNLAWKPHDGFKAHLSWLSSIRRWQARLRHGLGIQCPVLMMTSDRRGDPVHAHDEVVTTDSVLDPRQMWRLAARLGDDVEVRALEGGAHDLSLSPEPARTRFIQESLDWLDRVTAGEPAADPRGDQPGTDPQKDDRSSRLKELD